MVSSKLLDDACREFGHDCPMNEAISVNQLLKELVAMENLSGAFDYEMEQLESEQNEEAEEVRLVARYELERDYSEYLASGQCTDSV